MTQCGELEIATPVLCTRNTCMVQDAFFDTSKPPRIEAFRCLEAKVLRMQLSNGQAKGLGDCVCHRPRCFPDDTTATKTMPWLGHPFLLCHVFVFAFFVVGCCCWFFFFFFFFFFFGFLLVVVDVPSSCYSSPASQLSNKKHTHTPHTHIHTCRWEEATTTASSPAVVTVTLQHTHRQQRMLNRETQTNTPAAAIMQTNNNQTDQTMQGGGLHSSLKIHVCPSPSVMAVSRGSG